MADAIGEIKTRLDVAEVIGDRVALKKAGSTLKGLCPFHSEKTPSFVVFPETGTWKCFGCGEGGDIFGFVMKSENVDFREALRVLAARAGVELQPGRPREEKGESETLYEVNAAAASHFRSMLDGPAGSRAREYLKGRAITPDSIDQFAIGYAPDAGAGLAHHLIQAGYERSLVLQAGLAGENESGGLYDRFRNRIVFPIRDVAGRVLGFGGRGMAADAQPKYLNTPQTPVFDKGGNLYAVDRAKDEIRRTGQAVIVEGYMDAIMAHQHDFRNVVASLGTSVTDRQISQLKRWASELLFALDPDVAGQEATARGLAVAMEALDREATPVPSWRGFVDYVYRLKTTIKIIDLPPGRDPDDLIRESPEDWKARVRDAAPVQDFFLERVRRKHDLTSAAGKSAAAGEAMAVIGQIPDPVQQAHYVQKLASLLAVDERVLLQQARASGRRSGRQVPGASRDSLRRGAPPTGPGPDVSPPPAGQSRSSSPQRGHGIDAEAYCLALLLREPSLAESGPKVDVEHFQNPVFRELYSRLLQYLQAGQSDASTAPAVEKLRDDLEGALRDGLERVLEMEDRFPALFDGPRDKAYRSAAVTILLNNLALRRRQLEAMQSEVGPESDPKEFERLVRMQHQMAQEAHRIHLLGVTVPELRFRHKEVRYGE